MDISAMVVILTVFLSAIFGIAGLFIWDCEDRNPKILAAVIFLVLLTPGIITAYNGVEIAKIDTDFGEVVRIKNQYYFSDENGRVRSEYIENVKFVRDGGWYAEIGHGWHDDITILHIPKEYIVEEYFTYDYGEGYNNARQTNN